jgi:hypothetical protein
MSLNYGYIDNLPYREKLLSNFLDYKNLGQFSDFLKENQQKKLVVLLKFYDNFI